MGDTVERAPSLPQSLHMAESLQERTCLEEGKTYLEAVYKFIAQKVSERGLDVYSSITELRSAVEGVTVDVENVVAERYARLERKKSKETKKQIVGILKSSPKHVHDEHVKSVTFKKRLSKRLDDIVKPPSQMNHSYCDGIDGAPTPIQVEGAAVREMGTQISTVFPLLSKSSDKDDVLSDALFFLDAAVSLLPAMGGELHDARRAFAMEKERTVELEAQLADARLATARLEEKVRELETALSRVSRQYQEAENRANHLDREVKIVKSALHAARDEGRGEADEFANLRLRMSSPQYLSEVRFMIEEILNANGIKDKLTQLQSKLLKVQNGVWKATDAVLASRKHRRGSVIQVLPADESTRQAILDSPAFQKGEPVTLEQKVEELQGRLAVMRSALKEAENDRDDVVRSLAQKADKCSALEAKIDIFIADRQERKAEISRLKAEIERLGKDCSFFEDQNEALRFSATKATAEQENLQRKMQEAQAEIDAVRMRNQELEESLSTMEGLYEDYRVAKESLVQDEEHITYLNQELKVHRERLDELNRSLDEADSAYLQLQTVYRATRADYDAVLNEREQLTKEVQRRTSENFELQREIAKVKDMLTNETTSRRDKERILHDAEGNIKRLSSVVSEQKKAVCRLFEVMQGLQLSLLDNAPKLQRIFDAVNDCFAAVSEISRSQSCQSTPRKNDAAVSPRVFLALTSPRADGNTRRDYQKFHCKSQVSLSQNRPSWAFVSSPPTSPVSSRPMSAPLKRRTFKARQPVGV